MVLAIIFSAPERINIGILVFFLHRSPMRLFRLLKGLSNTAATIYEFLARYLRAVTAPIDLPHIAILVTFYLALICIAT